MHDNEWFEQLAWKAYHSEPFADTRFPPSAYYRFLRLLAEEACPNLSVELGVCGGGGSLHLALGWPEGIVVGVDVTPADAGDWVERKTYVIEFCSNFRYWHGDSSESAALVHEEYGDVDILFIDTTHTYEQTRREFTAWQPHLSDHAVVCLDDMFFPGMDRIWAELPGRKIRLDMLHDSSVGPDGYGSGGFGVIYGLKD